MSDCNENVGRGAIAWPCNLEKSHDGPHSAREVSSSVRERHDWETRNKRRTAADLGGVPTVESLGMQGKAKSSVDGLVDESQRESRREHPDIVRRRRAGTLDDTTIENELVRTAGNVDMSNPHIVKAEDDPAYAFYLERERRAAPEPWVDAEDQVPDDAWVDPEPVDEYNAITVALENIESFLNDLNDEDPENPLPFEISFSFAVIKAALDQ
jgi:hypothetical protein